MEISLSQRTRACYSRHGRAPGQKQTPVTSRKALDPVGVGKGRLHKEAHTATNDTSALLGGKRLLLKAWPGSKAKASPRHPRKMPDPIRVGGISGVHTIQHGEGPLLKACPGSKAKAHPHHLKTVWALGRVGLGPNWIMHE